jgi:hypothetical protein
MDDRDDEIRQAEDEIKRKMQAAKLHPEEEDEDTGAHLMPERDIGSQRKATSSSRTPSNET